MKALIILGIELLIFIVILVILITLGSKNEIISNWPKYRCRPDIMPFAGLYGYNAAENIEYCMKNIFLKEAAGVLAPVYEQASNFNNSVTQMGSGMMNMRTSISSLTDGVGKMVRSFHYRIQAVLQVLKGKFENMREMMGRTFALFFAIIYAGLSALAAGSTFAKGTIFGFLNTFCFPAGTPIKMANGTFVPIEKLRVDMKLWESSGENNTVTSTLLFDGSGTDLCRIDGITLSKNHLVRFDNDWIHAGFHPSALPVTCVERLYCLNTSLHRFWAGDLLVADYDETEDANMQAQTLVEKKLNAGRHGNTVDDYALGLAPSWDVLTKRGWKQLDQIQIGEEISTGRVIGKVYEKVKQQVFTRSTGTPISAACLVWDDDKWTRGSEAQTMESVFINLVIDGSNSFTVRDPHTKKIMHVRDYVEVADWDIEDVFIRNMK